MQAVESQGKQTKKEWICSWREAEGLEPRALACPLLL